MEETDVLHGGTVVSVNNAGGMVVDVNGVELYVSISVNHTGCTCCGDTTELTVSYNQSVDHRVRAHGSEDPLNIK